MGKLIKWFKNLKFRNKITLISLLVSLIPVIMLGSFCYLQIRDLLITRETEVLAESLNQASNTLEYKTKSYYNVINHIVWDKSLRDSLHTEYSDNFEMYLTYRDVIDPLFMTTRSLHSEIDTITVYTSNKMHPHGNMLRPLSDILDTPWLNDILATTSPQLIVSAPNKQLNIICQLYGSTDEYTNIIYLDISYDHTFNAMSTLFDDSYGIIILDENQNLVYEFHHFSDKDSSYKLSPTSLLQKLSLDTLGKDYVFDTRTLATSKWTAYLYRPIRTVSASAQQIAVTVLAIIMSCIFIVLFSSYSLSAIIVRPLERLTHNMKQIESGDLSVTVRENSTDEIGLLIQRFGYMVNQLKYLIHEVYESKISQQEYEMKALQAQINPHFFYNSLSLINSKAIMAEQEDISQMAQFLSTFYRTTLNRGKNTISVEDEWNNVMSYIQIQRMMHSNSFDVSYNIDKAILNHTILNLILQPLVENAIDHGLDHKETPGRGLLTITAKQSKYYLIFTISDNGSGIEADILDNILTTETSGYGVQNVHRRIQLYYGAEFGLSYRSTVGEGTRVLVTIPKKLNK